MIVFSPDALLDIERVREFLHINNPGAAKRAMRVIFDALEKMQEFPDLGRPTEDAEIRQIVVLFGSSGYIVRYKLLHEQGALLVTRIWHSREARK